jgi:hypothetical protein
MINDPLLGAAEGRTRKARRDSNRHGHVPDSPTGVAVVRLLLKVSVKLPGTGTPRLVTAVPVSQNVSPLGRVIIALYVELTLNARPSRQAPTAPGDGANVFEPEAMYVACGPLVAVTVNDGTSKPLMLPPGATVTVPDSLNGPGYAPDPVPVAAKPKVPVVKPVSMSQPEVSMAAVPVNDSPFREGGAAHAAAGTGGGMNATTNNKGKARESRPAKLDTVTSLAFGQPRQWFDAMR